MEEERDEARRAAAMAKQECDYLKRIADAAAMGAESTAAAAADAAAAAAAAASISNQQHRQN